MAHEVRRGKSGRNCCARRQGGSQIGVSRVAVASGPAERSGVVPAYNRNAVRVPSVRKAILEEWQLLLQLPGRADGDVDDAGQACSALQARAEKDGGSLKLPGMSFEPMGPRRTVSSGCAVV